MTTTPTTATTTHTCGLVMPISAIDGCTTEHWLDVRRILTEAVQSIDSPKFSTKLVSDAEDVGIIQKRIIQTLYDADIVVCDVSGKNPNVMFELGMRLAFDKPVVIVKDDKTDYSFDTGIIEHVVYPRDLRFARIVEFKELLAQKIASTSKKYPRGGKSSPFLKSFGTFEIASIEHTQVSGDRLVLSAIEDLQSEMRILRRRIDATAHRPRADVESRDLGFSRLVEVVSKLTRHMAESDLSTLASDEAFIRRVEDEVLPQRYFRSSAEFRETLAMILSTLGRPGAR